LKAHDLASAAVPFLLVLERVRADGWQKATTENPAVALTNPHPVRFSTSMLTRRIKPYFQCLVFLPQLFAKGLTRLTHTQCSSYYSSVLRAPSPGDIPLGRKASEYHDLNDDLEPGFDVGEHSDGDAIRSGGDDSSDDPKESPPVLPPAPAPAEAVAIVEPGAGLDGAIGSDDGSDAIASERGDPISSSSSSDDDASHSSTDIAYRDVYTIGNVRVTLDTFEHKHLAARSHKRLLVMCRGCGHGNTCQKKRGIGVRQTSRLGLLEPVAFLLAWHRMGPAKLTKRAHVSSEPSQAAVDEAYRDLHLVGV
jgi:hypothetical protein